MGKMNSNREDYLQAIYRLSRQEGYTTNKSISEYLKVSKPSVTVMLRKLEVDGLLVLEKNRISLSDKGRERAQGVLSKHRLWEYFLKNNLDMDEELIHDQADLLEHVTGDALRDALNKYLGYPESSPNGNVIYENIEKEEQK